MRVGDEYQDIDGATSEEFTTDELEGDVGTTFTFDLKVTTCDCTVYSGPVTVTLHNHSEVYASVEDSVIPFVGITWLHSQVIGGLGSNSYQWQRNIAGVWTNIAGAVSADYQIIGAIIGAGTHQFRVVVNQDENCEGIGGPVTVTITS